MDSAIIKKKNYSTTTLTLPHYRRKPVSSVSLLVRSISSSSDEPNY